MRRKRGSTVALAIVPQDDLCTGADGSRMHSTRLSGPAHGLELVDSWPAAVPVTERELDIIETYLGQMIGDVLKG